MEYIAFEGIDGSGKTTVAKYLYKYLKDMGYSAVYTQEPYTSEVRDKIKNISNPYEQLYWFLWDRRKHMNIIRNLWYSDAVDFIISDRCYLSTLVYQGYGTGLDVEFLNYLHLNTVFITPDIVVYLDCDVDVALDRIQKRDGVKEDVVILKDFLQKVRNGYLSLLDNQGFTLKIDANKDIKSVYKDLLEEVKEWVS